MTPQSAEYKTIDINMIGHNKVSLKPQAELAVCSDAVIGSSFCSTQHTSKYLVWCSTHLPEFRLDSISSMPQLVVLPDWNDTIRETLGRTPKWGSLGQSLHDASFITSGMTKGSLLDILPKQPQYSPAVLCQAGHSDKKSDAARCSSSAHVPSGKTWLFLRLSPRSTLPGHKRQGSGSSAMQEQRELPMPRRLSHTLESFNVGAKSYNWAQSKTLLVPGNLYRAEGSSGYDPSSHRVQLIDVLATDGQPHCSTASDCTREQADSTDNSVLVRKVFDSALATISSIWLCRPPHVVVSLSGNSELSSIVITLSGSGNGLSPEQSPHDERLRLLPMSLVLGEKAVVIVPAASATKAVAIMFLLAGGISSLG